MLDLFEVAMWVAAAGGAFYIVLKSAQNLEGVR